MLALVSARVSMPARLPCRYGDLRPFRATEELGLAPVSNTVYAASLYRRGVLDDRGVLTVLARFSARSTVSPQLIELALG